jgi:hypothetical protein
MPQTKQEALVNFCDKRKVPEVFTTITENPSSFRPEFFEWLSENWHIWRAFEREARRIRAKGFKHYSALTILFFLRHYTALYERAPSTFKINNNFAPDCARLLMMTYPKFKGFFEKRTRTATAIQ